MKVIKVPTGKIFIVDGKKGKLECLSLGDYGREKNVKADFLGLTNDINGVPNGEVMPLSEKWVVTISSQYGCSMNCKFCCVPKVGKGINATLPDLDRQVLTALLSENCHYTKRLNIHYARMGEPTFNWMVINHAELLGDTVRCLVDVDVIHPVVSTMLPKQNVHLYKFLYTWCNYIKNKVYRGDAGLQFSINSTNDKQREEMFSGNSLSLSEISKLGDYLPNPKGRKYALNFALADGYEVDAKKLKTLFDPAKFMVKITPMHRTDACTDNGIKTTGGYEYFTPYKSVEQELKEAGFDVLVFVPSYDEDDGLITCGNAILSGSVPQTKHTVVEL